MARYFLSLSYDGREFSGWQVQINTQNTIQQVLEEKFQMLTAEKISLVGCGRTDAGVSARSFYAHFDSESSSFTNSASRLVFKLNQVLPPAIAVHGIHRVADDAHARYDATERAYHYFVHTRKNPFRRQYSAQVDAGMDFTLMNEAAERLLAHNDFTSFSKLRTQNKTNTCKITSARWIKSGPAEWRFTIHADRFLRGMVRAIVGSLLLVGRGKITVDDFEDMITARNRNAAGSNAPAHALFLAGIRYPKEIFL